MVNRLLATAALISLLFISGCATPTKMAFHDDSQTASKTENPIFLMTATLRNKYRTSFQPELLVVNVERSTIKSSADRINFTMDNKAHNNLYDHDVGRSYLLRMELEDGSYVLRGMFSMSNSILIQGTFFTPIHANFDANGPGIFYLGHAEAIIRKRKGDEFKAGSSIPLIDQAVVGASGGTFDIEISDRWNKDEAIFRERFPALAKVQIKKAILPPFDREKAQKWWEEH